MKEDELKLAKNELEQTSIRLKSVETGFRLKKIQLKEAKINYLKALKKFKKLEQT